MDCWAGLFDFLKSKPPEEQPALMLNQPSPPEVPPVGSVLGLPSERRLPPLFRSTDDLSSLKGSRLSEMGLSALRMSGSGQFDREQLYMLQTVLLGKAVHVIDLRAEPHGIINRAAITWAIDEMPKSAFRTQSTEKKWLEQLVNLRRAPVQFYAPGSFSDSSAWQPIELVFDVRTTATPARMIAEARFGYHRIAFMDGALPSDAVVNQIVKAMQKISEGSWIHLHCDTGGYRTSLCFTMWDMMNNFSHLSPEEIIERQRRLGGVDLSKTPEVRDFLLRFYEYCQSVAPNFSKSWSSRSPRNE